MKWMEPLRTPRTRSLRASLALLAVFAVQTESLPIAWQLTVKDRAVTVKPGAVFNARLSARIEEGWHLYALDQLEGGPIPTRITGPPEQNFELTGSIESPAPLKTRDENFDLETEYYEQSVTFTLPVRAAAKAPAGRHKLQVQVRFQACSSQLCLPPKTVKLDLDLEVARN